MQNKSFVEIIHKEKEHSQELSNRYERLENQYRNLEEKCEYLEKNAGYSGIVSEQESKIMLLEKDKLDNEDRIKSLLELDKIYSQNENFYKEKIAHLESKLSDQLKKFGEQIGIESKRFDFGKSKINELEGFLDYCHFSFQKLETSLGIREPASLDVNASCLSNRLRFIEKEVLNRLYPQHNQQNKIEIRAENIRNGRIYDNILGPNYLTLPNKDEVEYIYK